MIDKKKKKKKKKNATARVKIFLFTRIVTRVFFFLALLCK